MTLAENSEMQFTEFLLTPQQRRTVVNLALGKLRVITAKIFGAGSATEVRTANTVAGVRGTTFVVIFIPPEETDVIALDGVVAVQNPNLPQLEPVPANFLTQVIGDTAPSRAAELLPSDRQGLELGLQLTEHIPAEVKRGVWLRDLGLCAFVGTNGRRCAERGFLEFHHVHPYAAGGEATVENVQLRCRRHNAYEARAYFGPDRPGGQAGFVREEEAAYGVPRCRT